MTKRTEKPKLTVQEKLASEAYRTKRPYPSPTDPNRKALKKAHNEDTARLEDQFRADLFEEYGVSGHPKANLCYSKAWEHGHSAGLSEVALYFEDFVELITG